MRFRPDEHQGMCTHCQTEVPKDAVVCTGCGARWGSSRGLTRQQIYDLGKARLKLGSIVGLILLLFYSITMYLGSLWGILAMVIGFLAGPACVGLMLNGLLTMSRAKRVNITWWRTQS